ncbi:hypothetical protein KKF34_19570 [Myxococcota bacterium]|nr:hypothetical protein [Myxococcota bacterium]MBU1380223.1 hypothetical protein [Myxococcota bacterium]MBU1499089.1 hypothetical protein [Myxococcota bacterium]
MKLSFILSILLMITSCYRNNSSLNNLQNDPLPPGIELLEPVGSGSSSIIDYYQFYRKKDDTKGRVGASAESAALLFNGINSAGSRGALLVESFNEGLKIPSPGRSFLLKTKSTPSIPVVSGYFMYFTVDNVLYAYDYIHEKTLWKADLKAFSDFRFVVSDRVLILCRKKGTILASFDPVTGKKLKSETASPSVTRIGNIEIIETKEGSGCTLNISHMGKKKCSLKLESSNWFVAKNSVISIGDSHLESFGIEDCKSAAKMNVPAGSSIIHGLDAIFMSRAGEVTELSLPDFKAGKIFKNRLFNQSLQFEYLQGQKYFFHSSENPGIIDVSDGTSTIFSNIKGDNLRVFRLGGRLMFTGKNRLYRFDDTLKPVQFDKKVNYVRPMSSIIFAAVNDTVFILDNKFNINDAVIARSGNVLKILTEGDLVTLITDRGLEVHDLLTGNMVFIHHRKTGMLHMFTMHHGRLFGFHRDSIEVLKTVDFRQYAYGCKTDLSVFLKLFTTDFKSYSPRAGLKLALCKQRGGASVNEQLKFPNIFRFLTGCISREFFASAESFISPVRSLSIWTMKCEKKSGKARSLFADALKIMEIRSERKTKKCSNIPSSIGIRQDAGKSGTCPIYKSFNAALEKLKSRQYYSYPVCR